MSFQRASLFLAGSQVSVAMYSSGSCAGSTDYRPILHNQTAFTLKGTFLFEAVGSRLGRSVSTLTARAGIDPSPCLKLSTQNVDSWTAAGGDGVRTKRPVSAWNRVMATRARTRLDATLGIGEYPTGAPQRTSLDSVQNRAFRTGDEPAGPA